MEYLPEALIPEFAQKIGALVSQSILSSQRGYDRSLALSEGIEWEAGDEVAISDFSFPATANVVEDLGAKPIFVDVNINHFQPWTKMI